MPLRTCHAAPARYENDDDPGVTPGRRGADDRDRTGDLHLGKVTLYQLSHIREDN